MVIVDWPMCSVVILNVAKGHNIGLQNSVMHNGLILLS